MTIMLVTVMGMVTGTAIIMETTITTGIITATIIMIMATTTDTITTDITTTSRS
jgi:hypothetical protein